MKQLKKHELYHIHGGTGEDSGCTSFKDDLKNILHSVENKVSDSADTLSEKINALIEKYK